MRVGFPHSEIPGSKLVCQLPGAYRRLRRPSSPVIAKASTTCTCSLDPITLSPRPLESKLELQVNSCLPHPESFCSLRTQRYNLCPSRFTVRHGRIRINADLPRFAMNRDLYFFRIFKEQLQPVDSRRVECSGLRTNPQRSTLNSGVEVVEVNGIEPMTSCLQSRRSPN